MAADSGKWFVIVNPVAGSGRGLDHFPQISKHLRDAHILCEPVFTEHKFHATELTVTAVREGYRRIIVVGGDGTLHEVVNGLFIQQEVCPDEVLVARCPCPRPPRPRAVSYTHLTLPTNREV